MKGHFRYIIVFLIVIVGPAKSQFVEIPDPNFRTWLINNGFSACMNGTQMDTSCSAITTTTWLAIENADIDDLSGIRYFDALSYLSCKQNNLTTLPELPAGLQALQCRSNNLTTIAELPAGLQNFDCLLNQITSIPTLPPQLTVLSCSGNLLTSLPPLPSTLIDLFCMNNQLTEVPALPPSLERLYLWQNSMTELPPLPASLRILSLDDNNLNVLPGLPEGLIELGARNIHLQQMPALPSSLTTLSVASNPELESLPAVLPPGLVSFACYGSNLHELPALPSTLRELNCSYNNITEIPPLPDSMRILDVSGNPALHCLPPLKKLYGVPGTNPYLSIANTAITCLPNIIAHPGSFVWDNLPLCGIFSGNGCNVSWNIAGSVFNDVSENCLSDQSEPRMHNIKLQLFENDILQQQVFSTASGWYSFNTEPGNFAVSVDTVGLPFTIDCTADNPALSNITTVDSLDFSVDLAMRCKPGVDAAIFGAAVTSGLLFPAQESTISVYSGEFSELFGTNCTPLTPATLKVYFVGPVTLSGMSGNGTASGDTVTWIIDDLSLSNFNLHFITDTSATSDDEVCLHSEIMLGSGSDYNLTNNAGIMCFPVVNSYDPNVKEVYPEKIDHPGDWHTYTIHFQNTGTAPAIHILVKDTLDQNLDWSSFQRVAASHDNLTQVLNNGIVHFNFPNIYLADSTSDEPNSHGWIQYRIKTNAELISQTIIHNTAAIYFDFNEPIITNDAVITYCTAVNVELGFWMCNGESVTVDGVVYTDPGLYSNTYTTSFGCDSIVEILITPILNLDVILSGTTLTAAPGFTYQWIDCLTGAEISGATADAFTPETNGSYSVQISGAGCSKTSVCKEVIVSGIKEINSILLTLNPNPAKDILTIGYSANIQNSIVVITDLAGRVVLRQPLVGDATQLNITGISQGTYLVNIVEIQRSKAVKKLVIVK